ncbi:Putative RNA-directed DNA polymerase [Arachis hypogaea]|nr:Putative RNA-directed DNA polymerase [Arachis hypogaea]
MHDVRCTMPEVGAGTRPEPDYGLRLFREAGTLRHKIVFDRGDMDKDNVKKSHKPYHCKPTPPPQGVEYCRRRRTQSSPSKFAIRHLSSLVLQVFNPCSLSPIAAASSSSASVVFVCSAVLPSSFVCRSRSRLRSAVVFVRVLRRSRSLGVHRSRSLAVHRSSSHSSGSHVAPLQTLRPTRALHPAVELLSFVAVSSLNPPPDNTLTQHQYSSSNSASSDFYYN